MKEYKCDDVVTGRVEYNVSVRGKVVSVGKTGVIVFVDKVFTWNSSIYQQCVAKYVNSCVKIPICDISEVL